MPGSRRFVVLFLFAASFASAADKPVSDWVFRPVKPPAVPTPPAEHKAWVRNPVDAFVLAKLLANGLKPSSEADRRTLARRLFIDLTGLPPTPDELEAFLKDDSKDAYEKLVDKLLASPRYGERWARHWLDVAHYADSHGQDQDRFRPNAWPYRDYVIKSLNADKPYSRLVKEQIAGEVMFPDDPAAVVATGFLAAGPWDESGLRDINADSLDRQVARVLDRDDIVTTVMTTFAGLTVHCARCHDHKFDPIPTADYYALQAVFAGIDKAEREYDADPAVAKQRASLSAELAAARGRRGDPRIAPRLERELRALPAPAKVYCGTNRFAPDGSFKPAPAPRPIHILRRGDVTRPGKEVKPGTVEAVEGLSGRFRLKDANDEGERRAMLAEWLTDDKNPLTWRVIVNRVWHYHFGRGIVVTPNDLGAMGGTPSHPELLDWLADDFRKNGGSLKKLHKLIVTSSTYRQAVTHDAAAEAKDADNRLLWRMNRTRLDAETVRDAVLLAAGRLDDTQFGPPVKHFATKPGIHVTPEADYDAFDVNTARRRSIYRFVFRTKPDPFLAGLDCPDASASAPVRSVSVGAPQALAMWNDKFVLANAEHLAALAGNASTDEAEKVRFAAKRVLLRAPTADEETAWTAYARKHGLANLCRVLFNTSEFTFVE